MVKQLHAWQFDAMKTAYRAAWILGGVATLGALCAIFRPNGDVAAFIQHPATSAWVQAVGSVAAIVWAARIAAGQSREALERERRNERRENRRSAEARIRSLGIAAHQMGSVSTAIRLLGDAAKVRGSDVNIIAPLARASVGVAVEALETFPLSSLDHPIGLKCVTGGIVGGRSAVQYLDGMWEALSKSPKLWTDQTAGTISASLIQQAEIIEMQTEAVRAIASQLLEALVLDTD